MARTPDDFDEHPQLPTGQPPRIRLARAHVHVSPTRTDVPPSAPVAPQTPPSAPAPATETPAPAPTPPAAETLPLAPPDLEGFGPVEEAPPAAETPPLAPPIPAEIGEEQAPPPGEPQTIGDVTFMGEGPGAGESYTPATDYIRALRVDPEMRSVDEVQLPVDEAGPLPEALAAHLGAEQAGLDVMGLPGHLSLDGGDRLIAARDWRRRVAGGDLSGPALIAAQDAATGAWRDTTLRPEDVLQAIQFADEEALRGATPAQIEQARRMLADEFGPMTTARATGLSPEAVGVVREEMQRAAVQGPAMGALRPDEPLRLTPTFRARLPEVRARLEAEFRRMLPSDTAVRLADRTLFLQGVPADEIVSQETANRWLLRVSLERGPAVAKIKGFHGIAAHILRGYGGVGLYTPQEWQVLLDRAKKTGMEAELRREGTWDIYRQLYAQHGPVRQREYLDQELVGRLAEHWAAGRSYGAQIDALLQRIARLIEAIRNALRGMGFQTADDVFERARSGEIARRLEGGRREPYFGPPGGPDLASLRSWLGLDKAPDAALTRPRYRFDSIAFTDAMGPWLAWAESPQATPEARAWFLRPGTPQQQEEEWRSLIAHARREHDRWKAWRESAGRAVQEGRRAPSPPPHRAWRPPKR